MSESVTTNAKPVFILRAGRLGSWIEGFIGESSAGFGAWRSFSQPFSGELGEFILNVDFTCTGPQASFFPAPSGSNWLWISFRIPAADRSGGGGNPRKQSKPAFALRPLSKSIPLDTYSKYVEAPANG